MGPKKKQEKMSLGTFLGDQSLGSWADEMEDTPVNSGGSKTGYGSDSRRDFGSRPGFGDMPSGFSERNYQPREQLPLPTKPPYTAHLGNLSFEVTSTDIEDFFSGCSVTNVRVVEDKMDHKPKGFGYVEFGTLDGLKKALDANGSSFQGRNIRVSIAEPPKERQEAREITDWTRKGPLPDLPQNQRRPSERGGYRNNYDNVSDAGSDRGGPPRRNFSFEPSDGKPRDFGNWERKGPLSPAQPHPNHMSEAGRIRSNERPFERKPSPAWGEGRSQDGSRPPRREFQDRPVSERAPTAPELDPQWRTGMKADAPVKSPTATPDVSMPSSPAAAHPAVPATRPRLNLQKRTVSEAPADEANAQAGASDSKASPFGAARPIDTATREKEIEEKRLAVRQKKEEEDREREKKKKEEEAEKKRIAAEKAKNEQVTSPVSESGKTFPRETTKDVAKENGATSTAPAKSYEILRRMTDENGDDEDAEEDAGEAPTNGVSADRDSTKPVAPMQVESVISNDPAPTALSNAAADDGWQKVQTKPSKPTRGRKPQNRGGARAIVS